MDNCSFYTLYSKPYTDSKGPNLFASYEGYIHLKESDIVLDNGLLTSTSISIENTDYIPLKESNSDFGFMVLFFDLVVIILLLGLYRKHFMSSLRALFSYKYYQRIESKTSLLKHPLTYILLGLFIINFSLFIDIQPELIPIENYIYGYGGAFGYIAGLLLLFYAVKALLVFISAQIFNVPIMGRIYTDYMFLSIIGMSVLLSFLLWFDIFVGLPILIHITWLFVGVYSLSRIFLTYRIIMPKSTFSPFHFFLYLCTVEILPLIVLGKLMIQGDVV